MLPPGQAELGNEQAFNVLGKAVLFSVRAVGHIAGLVGIGVIEIPGVDLLDRDARAFGQEVLDQLVHKYAGFAAPILAGADPDIELRRIVRIEEIVTAGVVALLYVGD